MSDNINRKNRILPVILSGGFGTRLWPLSRQEMPKQFMTELFKKESLFAKSLKLVNDSEIFLPSIAVTHKNHNFFALDNYHALNIEPEIIILEPQAKNTAMAILIATIKAQQLYPDDDINILILPSDHLIAPQNLFVESLDNALQVVDNKIITFGINPVFPATGYGYIKRSAKISQNCFTVEKFVEKPNKKTAAEYLTTGDYLWNAGIFLFESAIYLQEVKQYLPNLITLAQNALDNAIINDKFCEILVDDYSDIEDISVDYGILEKSQNVATTTLLANWSDVGDFKAVYDIKDKDKNDNVAIGDVALYDSKNSLIYAKNNLIACLGLDNIAVIESDDALLIADRNRMQEVKNITKDLLSKNRLEVISNKKGFRPWGYYQTLSENRGFKVKRIFVKPHSAISLQLHNKRSEHWVVIKGIAIVEKNSKKFTLCEGESTFIPVKTKHRITNNQDTNLEIIEVQMGEYVGEDDIVRFEDNYGRS